MLTPQTELTVLILARKGLPVKSSTHPHGTITARCKVSESSCYAILRKHSVSPKPKWRDYNEIDVHIKQLEGIVNYDPNLEKNEELHTLTTGLEKEVLVPSAMGTSKRGLPFRRKTYRAKRRGATKLVPSWIMALFKWFKYSLFGTPKLVVEKPPTTPEPPINKATEAELYAIYDELMTITNKFERSITRIYTYENKEETDETL